MNIDSHLVGKISPSPNFGSRQGRRIDALILHYTGMRSGDLARERLLNPTSQVSAHYLVWEDGRIEQLVAEAERAWHAGCSFWAGERDMNSVSIGIEIVNGGHDFGCPPYPTRQIEAVVALARDICTRRSIHVSRVLGHSDVAPDRKRDPGEWFPWKCLFDARLSRSAATRTSQVSMPPPATCEDILGLQRALQAFGFESPTTGVIDPATASIIAAFQRHYRPARVDGVPDHETLAALATLG